MDRNSDYTFVAQLAGDLEGGRESLGILAEGKQRQQATGTMAINIGMSYTAAKTEMSTSMS